MTETVIDFDALFGAYIAGKQKVWKHDRSKTLGASETFDCIRKQLFNKRGKEFGIEPDDDYEEDYGAMERGNMIEDHFVVPALQSQLPATGLELLFAGQSNQETLIKDLNSATPDGLITGIPKGKVIIRAKTVEPIVLDVQEGCIGLEVKSIDPRSNLTTERTKHRGQSQMGLGLIREMTEWKPRYWIILYVDASFVSKLTPFVVEFDPGVYRAGQLRAKELWSYKNPWEAPPEGKYDNACDHCKFQKACGSATLSAWAQTTDKSDPAVAAAITPLVEKYNEWKQKSETAEREFEVVKQALKNALTEAKVRKVVGDGFKINWISVKGRTYLDTKAMEADGIDLGAYQKEGQGHDQMRVTFNKESK